ncbi:MAG: glycosyltransferase family 2 protein [Candidatus Rokubacteria bacterium]|nr:glycosyltransferase family 2 protein [Candidatus Rokubacteria bacterium]
MTRPVVTVSILNYQRREILRRALERAVGQSYPALDVLVVDNASTDGSDRLVEREFPLVRLVRLPENIGCAARNAGVAAAKGEIVVTLDNDVLLTTADDVRTIVDIFERRPSVACASFKILSETGGLSRRDWCHPRDWARFADEEFVTDYVLEGASAVRRDAFERVGGYWAPLFLGHEGLDLALRLLEAGHDLLYSPRVRVTHLVAAEARPSSRIYYTFTRNAIWVALRNRRGPDAARAIGRDLALMAFTSARAGQFRGYVRGLRDGLLGVPRALATRRPMSRATSRRLRHIRRLAPGLLAKVRRHLEEPLI